MGVSTRIARERGPALLDELDHPPDELGRGRRDAAAVDREVESGLVFEVGKNGAH